MHDHYTIAHTMSDITRATARIIAKHIHDTKLPPSMEDCLAIAAADGHREFAELLADRAMPAPWQRALNTENAVVLAASEGVNVRALLKAYDVTELAINEGSTVTAWEESIASKVFEVTGHMPIGPEREATELKIANKMQDEQLEDYKRDVARRIETARNKALRAAITESERRLRDDDNMSDLAQKYRQLCKRDVRTNTRKRINDGMMSKVRAVRQKMMDRHDAAQEITRLLSNKEDYDDFTSDFFIDPHESKEMDDIAVRSACLLSMHTYITHAPLH